MGKIENIKASSGLSLGREVSAGYVEIKNSEPIEQLVILDNAVAFCSSRLSSYVS
jgi:hypothetical protein